MTDNPSYDERERRVHQLEEQLASGDLQRLYDVFHLLPAFVYLQADDYSIHFANRTFVELFGEPGEQLCHQVFRQSEKPCDPCRTFEVFENGKPVVWEWTDSRGRTFLVHDTLFPGMIDGKRLVMEVGRDITWWKKLELKLLESEKDLNRVQSIARIGLWQWDIASGDATWSDELFRIFGVEKQRPNFELARSLAHPEDRASWETAVAEAVKRKEPIAIDYRAVRPDGRVIWVRNESEPVFDAEGELIRYIGTAQDITEHKEADEALRDSEERYRALVEQAAEEIFVHDLEGRFRDANAVACEKLGYSKEELLDMCVPDVDPDFIERDDMNRFWSKLQTDAPVVFRARHRRNDGSTYPVEVSLNPITARGERLVLAFARDISERVRAEEERAGLERQLRQSHKMEAIGTMAGGIAHDFNNILGVIVGNAELAMDDLPDFGEARESLKEIADASARARDIVRQLLAYIRRGEEELRPVPARRAVKEAMKLIGASLPKTVRIHTEFKLGRERIMADPTQLHQVLMNLCYNAGQAMHQEGGDLTVSVDLVTPGEADAAVLGPERCLRIVVADTGPGISEGHIDRIFDPYFTTKKVGQGSGLGLAVALGIIKSWGGVIRAASTVGEGAAFTILLPLTREKPARVTPEQVMAVGGPERILFIDDEPRLAAMVKRLLESLGYRVVTRTDPVEALGLFREDPRAFDAVITDMTMPGMTGDRLAAEIRSLRPEMPILLCTGYSDLVNEKKAGELGVSAFLAKPLRREELAAALRSALNRSGED